MARKLKTFVTNLGFFELAVAAPSMKAALKAWGMRHNPFSQDLARQTEDPAIVAAATAAPGQVLRRPIGGKGKFSADAPLPAVKGAARPKKSKKVVPAAAIARIEAALQDGQDRHRKAVAAFDREWETLKRRTDAEAERWARQKDRLEQQLSRLQRG